jgi:hypothetical protein
VERKQAAAGSVFALGGTPALSSRRGSGVFGVGVGVELFTTGEVDGDGLFFAGEGDGEGEDEGLFGIGVGEGEDEGLFGIGVGEGEGLFGVGAGVGDWTGGIEVHLHQLV